MRRSDQFPHNLAIDVLTLLPAKSLMRFKCVSKLWHSTITNPSFVKSHRSCSLTRPDSSGLLISCPNNTFSHQHFFYANFQGYSGRHELTLPISHYDSLTQVINALVCFYDGNRVSVCNITTHQVLTLPVTSLNVNNHVNVPNYYFGFDHVNEEYKLLNMCTFRTSDDDSCKKLNNSRVEWEILTLGADSWRNIDAPPPFKFHDTSVFIYGFIYWLHRIEELSLVVVPFDVQDEKFHIINVPQNARPSVQPVQIGQRLALADVTHCISGFNNPLELWILTDRRNHTWIKTCIRFPFAVKPWQLERRLCHCVLPAANIPTGEIMFTPLKLSLPLPIVYYDAKTGEWITIKIAQLPLSDVLFGGKVCITPYVENILPLINHS